MRSNALVFGAVILSTPHKHHAAQIVAAAKAGKHVFCEKPLCTTAREMDAVIEAVTAARVQLGIGHERRFEPGIIDLRARLAAGELGTALAMEGNFSQDKFLTLSARQLAPVIRGCTRRAAFRDRHSSRRFVDCLPGQAQGGLGAARRARQSLRQRRYAWRHDRVRVGRQRPIDGHSGDLFYGPHRRLRLARLDRDSAIARIQSTPRAGTSPSRLAANLAATHSLPPHAAVRDNLEAFGRAAAGEAPYPVSIAEIDTNVRTFEAITRSALSGKVERI